MKRDLPSRCLIVILPRHQSGMKELHEKHAHAYLVIAVLLSGQSTRALLHGTKFLVFTTITFYGSSYLNLCSKPDTHNCQESPSVTIFLV